jgi:hypothetical protein
MQYEDFASNLSVACDRKSTEKKREERSSSAAGLGQTTNMCIWACWVGRAISAGKISYEEKSLLLQIISP